MNEVISLVIFTCQGKEHLLPACYDSFKQNCGFGFEKVILAVDGQIDQPVIKYINPDIVVQNYERKGYIFNILNALSLIETEYFFWLEDDFIFEQEVPLDKMAATLQEQERWAGIFLSRTAPLTPAEKQQHHFGEYYLPHFGYSVSPTLCRTKHIKAAFKALVDYPKNEQSKTYGFETFIDNYFTGNGLSYALLDPGNIPHVKHAGKLESTARTYHMINSLDQNLSDVNKEYISGFGYDKKISAVNKLSMVPKLVAAFSSLIFKSFVSRKAYDYSFRIYLAYRNKFNN